MNRDNLNSSSAFQPTWDDPVGPNAWNNLSWPGQEALHSGLVMLLAFDQTSQPRCIGTGFIVSARGRYAICATAAHNFYDGISRAQNRSAGRALSALPEFIPNFERVDIDPSRLQALYRHGDRIEGCTVLGATWVKGTDTAYFEIETRDPQDDDFIQGEWPIDGAEPAVGDVVGVVAYAQMDTQLGTKEDGFPAGEIRSQLLVRVGRVTKLNDGSMLVRTRCAETTIPVFGGMSGGPAFVWKAASGTPTVFGFISSDPEDAEGDEVAKHDFSVAGRSSIVLLGAQVVTEGAVRRVSFQFGPLDAVLGQLRMAWQQDDTP